MIRTLIALGLLLGLAGAALAAPPAVAPPGKQLVGRSQEPAPGPAARERRPDGWTWFGMGFESRRGRLGVDEDEPGYGESSADGRYSYGDNGGGDQAGSGTGGFSGGSAGGSSMGSPGPSTGSPGSSLGSPGSAVGSPGSSMGSPGSSLSSPGASMGSPGSSVGGRGSGNAKAR
jgi:hypothetical protein